MTHKAIRLRLPETGAMEIPVAEFALTRPSDASRMAGRARLLGALASMEEKSRSRWSRAVAQACRLFHSTGHPTTVRFVIGELHHQTLVEAILSISAEEPSEADGEFRWDEEVRAELIRLGSTLDRFEWGALPDSSQSLLLAQSTTGLVRATPAEANHWAELLRAKSLEEAVAISERGRQRADAELGIARSRSLRPEWNHEATADLEDLETLSLVARRATNSILILDAGGVIQWTNDAFTSQTGYTAAEIKGGRLDDLLFGPSTDPAAVREYYQAFRNGHDLTQDMMQYHRDGRTFWVECKLVPVHDAEGRIARWIVIQSDVTRRRQMEEALRAAKQSAEMSSRSKSEFLANMSHEIRTPLNAILGMTELALTTELTREQRDYLRTVQSSADTLLQLLNDVLDISKIEAGKLEIEEIDFNLAEIVRETLKALAVKAHEKGLELAVHMPMEIPQYLRGDPTRIRQVLFNLVGNAIKFTERGEVVVDVEQQWRTEEEVCLHFSVRDTGIGIPKDRLQRIFESFTQVDSSTARRFGGTGLGLTITSQLLRMMNGKIWVQSQEEKGSTFHFTIQLSMGNEPPPGDLAADAAMLAGKQALVVDDNATNRRILEEMLAHWGVSPVLCDGAEAALDQLEQASRNNKPFDLVLLDAMMPVVDGFQLAEIIQRRRDLPSGTVLMLSSADRPNSAVRCRKLGITTYLVKPVSASSLLEAILAALSDPVAPARWPEYDEADGTGGAEFQDTQAPSLNLIARNRPKRPLRVLVADDHEPNRSLAMKILERRGHHCVPAGDGEEAIAAYAQGTFDVVLMDVQMPGLDGYSATRAIRRRERDTGSHVAIIALTAHALSGDREKCLAAGMDAYLAKPIHARELVALVERMTGVDSDSDGEVAEPLVPATAARFNISAALDRMNGEIDLLKEHIGYVLNDAPVLIGRMHTAVQQSDARLLEVSAHRLKSLVSSYNHDEARDLAQSLETFAKEGQFSEASPTLNRLRPLVDEFTRAMKQYLDNQR